MATVRRVRFIGTDTYGRGGVVYDGWASMQSHDLVHVQIDLHHGFRATLDQAVNAQMEVLE